MSVHPTYIIGTLTQPFDSDREIKKSFQHHTHVLFYKKKSLLFQQILTDEKKKYQPIISENANYTKNTQSDKIKLFP